MGALSEQQKTQIGKALEESRIAFWCRFSGERDIHLVSSDNTYNDGLPSPQIDRILGVAIYASEVLAIETAFWDETVLARNPKAKQESLEHGAEVIEVDGEELQWTSLIAIQQAYLGL